MAYLFTLEYSNDPRDVTDAIRMATETGRGLLVFEGSGFSFVFPNGPVLILNTEADTRKLYDAFERAREAQNREQAQQSQVVECESPLSPCNS